MNTTTELHTAHERIADLERQLQQARTAPILDGTDPRLTDILDRAHTLADSLNLCDDYDRILEELGIPPRIREWTVTHYTTVTLTINTYVDAPTAEEAERAAEHRITRDRILEELEARGNAFAFELETESTEQQH